MNLTKTAPEVRTTNAPVICVPKEDFFFDGFAYFRGTGTGNFAGMPFSRALHGTVKIMRLKGPLGRYSLRSRNPNGDSVTFHVSPSTKVRVDGKKYTVESLYKSAK
jgi:hypothetical protein